MPEETHGLEGHATYNATMHQFEEPKFDEKEQRRIFARAAELQREEGLAMSASELEQVALEAGIDPRHVRRAMAEAETKTEPAAPRPLVLPLLVLGIFFFTQMYGVVGTLRAGYAQLYIPFALALLLGIAWSRTPRERALAYGTLFVWSGLVYGWCYLLGNGQFVDMGPIYLTRILALQAFLIMMGQGMAIWSRRGMRRKAESPARAEA